jgi:hypothetical protein
MRGPVGGAIGQPERHRGEFEALSSLMGRALAFGIDAGINAVCHDVSSLAHEYWIP